MKYSINSIGFIVAERDIYSLGGFIPKGSVGAKVANEDQISQDGECWVASGDISGRPDVRIKDNAYIGEWVASSAEVHTDGITEFSGDTVIPGKMVVRNPIADPKNNFFAKDSFIGISMDVLCGPSTTATAFPFEQGGLKAEAAKGTLFTSASMSLDDTSACRSAATLRLGRNTYLYIPTGYRARVFWAYYDTSGQLAYSGEATAVAAGLTKLDHSVYRLAMIAMAKNDGTATTPADLLATGAKILGHISSSANVDIRPESASGSYVMVNSSFIAETDNFGLDTTQLRFLAGSMYNTTMYTRTNGPGYKPYGTFRNVERLEYNQYLSDSSRVDANRDRYIVASDSPLVRINEGFLSKSVVDAGGVTLRRCIVPKAIFTDNLHNNNVYEDIDFSYAVDHLGEKAGDTNDLWSSHIQGLYSVVAARAVILGFVSRPGNLALGSVISSKIVNVPLGGDIIEQGTYAAVIGQFYEDGKSGVVNTRLRTGKPVSTRNMNLPDMPSGYVLAAAHYLDEGFKFAGSVENPTSINTAYPYVVFVITKTDATKIALAAEFIAFNKTMTYYDLSQVPEITGSAYVGAGCDVHGDVKLIGDPYVNRVFDLNVWERGGCQPTQGGKWQDGFFSSNAHNRYRSKDLIPVEPGGTVSRTTGGKMVAWYFDEFGNRTSSGGTGWVTSFVVPAGAYFVGIVLDVNGDGLVVDSDISVANVKYVRAFKKRRYITNELDRTSPEDILLSVDYFRRATVSTSAASAGVYYESLIYPSQVWLSLKRLLNAGASWALTVGDSTTYLSAASSWDALTKLIGAGIRDGVALVSLEVRKKDSSTIALADIESARLIIEFTPSPRIVVPYGVSNVWIEGTKVRMYDNSVISRTITKGAGVILKGDAVMGSVFTGDVCMCSNGHSDAIIKLP